MKVIAGILGGIILAALGAILITIIFAASPEKGGTYGAMSFFIFWVLGIVIAVQAKTAAKAWRRLLLTSAIFSFLLPLSGIIYTGSFIVQHVDKANEYAGAQATGAAIGGGIVSVFMGFVGFFLGAVFLVIGLLVGRDKQVVYIQAPPKSEGKH